MRAFSDSARSVFERAVRVLHHAMATADELGDVAVERAHVLAGLAAVEDGTAARVLAAGGVTADGVMREVRRLRG